MPALRRKFANVVWQESDLLDLDNSTTSYPRVVWEGMLLHQGSFGLVAPITPVATPGTAHADVDVLIQFGLKGLKTVLIEPDYYFETQSSPSSDEATRHADLLAYYDGILKSMEDLQGSGESAITASPARLHRLSDLPQFRDNGVESDHWMPVATKTVRIHVHLTPRKAVPRSFSSDE